MSGIVKFVVKFDIPGYNFGLFLILPLYLTLKTIYLALLGVIIATCHHVTVQLFFHFDILH